MLVVSANLWNINPFQHRAMQACLTDNPDIVVLSELRNSCVESARSLFASAGYQFVCQRVHGLMSIAVASRIAIAQDQVVRTGPFRKRPQLKLSLASGITVWGIHLDAPLSFSRYALRQKQLPYLAKQVIAADEPTVLVGDFNAYRNERIFQSFCAEIGDRTTDLSGHSASHPPAHSAMFTWPSIYPRFQIDHIVCTPPLQVSELRVGQYNGSDHLPIMGSIEGLESSL